MSHILITFLGKGKENVVTGYRETTYQFVDIKRKTAFFGLALADFLKPDKLIVFGTKASQWGALFENVTTNTDYDNSIFELIEAESENRVNQDMLDNFTSLMRDAVGLPIIPRLIPYGRDDREQFEILNAINNAVSNQSSKVSFDLTHGFRHLGMIGFLSAFLLERIYDLTVKDLWYGALDMTIKGVTPVVKLNGLVQVRKWIDGLDRFDSTGNYGVIAPLLREDGVDDQYTKALENAAFYEYTTNISDAKRRLQNFLPILNDSLPGASGLFQEKLSERLEWVKQAELVQHQRKLAEHYLHRKDYLRAAIFGWEALITLKCNEFGLHPVNERRLGTDQLREEMNVLDIKSSEVKRKFENLRQIRNTLAHGNPPENQHVRRYLRNEKLLFETLKKSFELLYQTN